MQCVYSDRACYAHSYMHDRRVYIIILDSGILTQWLGASDTVDKKCLIKCAHVYSYACYAHYNVYLINT